MGNLKEQIRKDLQKGLKEGPEAKVRLLKLLLSSILNKEIELNKKDEGLSEKEERQIIRSEFKKRKEALEIYEKAGREELAKNEQEEITLLQQYLPKELPEKEIEKLARETIKEIGAASKEDFGKIMKAVLLKTQDRADGKRVAEVVKKLLKPQEN
jgi:hypothetical protein